MGQKQKRKTYAEEFKAQMAMDEIKGFRTLNDLSAVHGAHSTVFAQWKRQLLNRAPELFRREPWGEFASRRRTDGPAV